MRFVLYEIAILGAGRWLAVEIWGILTKGRWLAGGRDLGLTIRLLLGLGLDDPEFWSIRWMDFDMNKMTSWWKEAKTSPQLKPKPPTVAQTTTVAHTTGQSPAFGRDT